MGTEELGRLLGKGKEAEVFACGDHVLKLYNAAARKSSAFREAANLAVVETLGVAAPVALGVRQIGDRWAVAMTLAAGDSFGEAMLHDPAQAPRCLESMVQLQLAIHTHSAVQLGSMKARLRTNIERSTMLGAARQRVLRDGLAELADGDRLCHGDFHPWNILGPLDGAMVVDWLDASRGNPASDVCRSYVLMKHAAPELASAYLELYAAVAGIARGEVLAWLPFVAAARLAEDVPQEVDGLMQMIDTI